MKIKCNNYVWCTRPAVKLYVWAGNYDIFDSPEYAGCPMAVACCAEHDFHGRKFGGLDFEHEWREEWREASEEEYIIAEILES
jgi:hypothetical protein